MSVIKSSSLLRRSSTFHCVQGIKYQELSTKLDAAVAEIAALKAAK